MYMAPRNQLRVSHSPSSLCCLGFVGSPRIKVNRPALRSLEVEEQARVVDVETTAIRNPIPIGACGFALRCTPIRLIAVNEARSYGSLGYDISIVSLANFLESVAGI